MQNYIKYYFTEHKAVPSRGPELVLQRVVGAHQHNPQVLRPHEGVVRRGEGVAQDESEVAIFALVPLATQIWGAH